MQAFFAGNGIDAFLGDPMGYTSMGNIVGLPELVIPLGFDEIMPGSNRKDPITVGIYGAPYQDSKVCKQCTYLGFVLSNGHFSDDACVCKHEAAQYMAAKRYHCRVRQTWGHFLWTSVPCMHVIT